MGGTDNAIKSKIHGKGQCSRGNGFIHQIGTNDNFIETTLHHKPYEKIFIVTN